MNNLILKDLLPDWLHEFADQAVNGEISFKDEYELQETLICSLRKMLSSVKLDSIFTVDREVRIDFALNNPKFKTKCLKRYIDVVIFKGLCIKESEEKYAIELKYPHNGQYPMQMYKFIQDISFMEEAQDMWSTGVINPFDGSYCLTFAKDYKFYQTPLKERSKLKIYQYFRNTKNIPIPNKPTCPVALKRLTSNIPLHLSLKGNRQIQWESSSTKKSSLKYYIITI